jgi:type IV pilus assembly protein PilO
MRANLTPMFKKVDALSLRVRIVIFVLTIALIAGLFTYFIYLPKSREIARLEQQLGELDRQLFLAKAKARNVEELHTELAELDADFKEALKLLPNEREIPSLLRTITQMGKDSNLEFLLFKPEKEVSKDFYIEIPVSIEVKGGFLDVAVFFDKVGGMKRIINMMNVSMRPERDFSTMLKTTCTAVTYRFRGENPTGGKTEGEKENK